MCSTCMHVRAKKEDTVSSAFILLGLFGGRSVDCIKRIDMLGLGFSSFALIPNRVPTKVTQGKPTRGGLPVG